jgi:hypothetical protein
MSMDLQDVAAIAEIVGVITIVITFLFLGLQIRGQRQAMIATLSQSISDAETTVGSQFLLYPDVWEKVITDQSFDDPVERRRAVILLNQYMTHSENRFRLYKLGYVDRQTWETSEEGVRLLANLKVLEEWYKAPSYANRTLEFREYLKSLRY